MWSCASIPVLGLSRDTTLVPKASSHPMPLWDRIVVPFPQVEESDGNDISMVVILGCPLPRKCGGIHGIPLGQCRQLLVPPLLPIPMVLLSSYLCSMLPIPPEPCQSTGVLWFSKYYPLIPP
jgi:hypothetical protein